jgi:hypothetical protein
MLKESKIRILENFYALDYTFFGKPVTKINVCCPFLIEEYMSVKGALLSVMTEMYNLIEHKPKAISEKVSPKIVRQMAIESAKSARVSAKKLVSTAKGKESVKVKIKEAAEDAKRAKFPVNLEKITQEKITEKAFSLAVDNILVGRAISESTSYKKLDSWDGRIIEDSYKLLRDQLVECAVSIIDSIEK